MERATRGLDGRDRCARVVFNQLSLIEFCLKNGSVKFKGAVEDALRPGLLATLDEDAEELATSIRGVATRVAELLESPETLRQAREEAQRKRSSFREAYTVGSSLSGGYSSCSSSQLRLSGYDSYQGGSLREKLGLQTEQSKEKPLPVPVAVDLLGPAEPKPSKQLKLLPPPPRKGGRPAPESQELLDLDLDAGKGKGVKSDAHSQVDLLDL